MELRYKLISKDGIFEVSGLPQGQYDRFFRLYDMLVSCGLYNRLVWANDKKNYTDFVRHALKSARGPVLDVPCGPATFTYKLYAEPSHPLVILSDMSMNILRFARRRIHKLNPQANVMFVRADAMNLPFGEGSMDTVLSQGFLHILDEPRLFLHEVERVLRTSGMAYFTSLVSDRPSSAFFMKQLYKMGHISHPRTSGQVLRFFDDTGLKIISHQTIGGMLYIIARKSQ